MIKIVNLQDTLNPISAAERVKVNQNWDAIRRGFSSLQNQIAFLSGGEDVDAIIQRINNTIAKAETDTQNAIDAINVNYQQLVNDINQSLNDLDAAITNSQNATQQATQATLETQSAINDARDAIAELISTINDFRNLGEYNSSTQYRKNNMVGFDGRTYIALQDNVNTPINNTSFWYLLADRGPKGDKGDTGETGAALSIQGRLNDTSELPPTGESGQAYTINGELYVWSENSLQWENVGNIKGEKGEDGLSAYQIAVANGFVGDEAAWVNSLKGERGEKGEPGEKGDDANVTEQTITDALGYTPANDDDVTTHFSKIASTDTLGHVRVDGETIVISEDGVISSIGSITPRTKIYGVKINTLDSNPQTSVTRTDDAVSMSVEDFWSVKPWSLIRPVLFKDGEVVAELPKTLTHSYTLDDGDIMIEFSKFYWKFERVGTDLYVRLADSYVDGFVSPAFKRGAVEKDKFYLGRYLGYENSSKLRSVKGYQPTGNKTIDASRTLAKANGTGYELSPYLQLLAVQILYLVQYANLDSQTSVGRGLVDSTSNNAFLITGGSDGKGMNFGETTGLLQMSLYGLEDFWGNKLWRIDGLFSDANRQLLIGNDAFNDTGSGYTNHGASGFTSNTGGYISDVQGGDETGFIVKTHIGSATTYYADGGYIYANCMPYFGGYCSSASDAGAFYLRVGSSASSAGANIGSRLCFL